MDSVFGIGFPELVLVLILAGIVLGPQRIRSVARQLGRYTAQMQRISQQFRRQLNAELDALDAAEVRETVDDVRALQKELKDLRQQVTQLSDDAVREGREALEEGEKLFQQPVVPPPTAPGETTGSKEAPEDDTDEEPALPPEIPQPIAVPDDPE